MSKSQLKTKAVREELIQIIDDLGPLEVPNYEITIEREI